GRPARGAGGAPSAGRGRAGRGGALPAGGGGGGGGGGPPRRYRAAGCDGIFVPALSDPAAIRSIAAEIALPLNVMVVPRLPPVAELAALGVRRVSAGAAVAQAAYAVARRAATRFLNDGGAHASFEATADYAELNALFASTRG